MFNLGGFSGGAGHRTKRVKDKLRFEEKHLDKAHLGF